VSVRSQLELNAVRVLSLFTVKNLKNWGQKVLGCASKTKCWWTHKNIFPCLVLGCSLLKFYQALQITLHNCLCTHVCLCVCTYVRVCVCMYVGMYVCTYYVRMCVYMYVRTYVCMHSYTYVCMYLCMYVRTYVCMYVCTYMCVCVCMYVRKGRF
jgi:hypothetical protein